MKSADIVIGEAYYAKVSYSGFTKVTALEKGVERQHGYRAATQKNGVRVRVEIQSGTPGNYGGYAAGDETVLATRYIERPWSEVDDQRATAQEAREDRAAALKDAFIALGFGVSERSFPATDVRVTTGGVFLTHDAADRLLDLTREKVA